MYHTYKKKWDAHATKHIIKSLEPLPTNSEGYKVFFYITLHNVAI